MRYGQLKAQGDASHLPRRRLSLSVSKLPPRLQLALYRLTAHPAQKKARPPPPLPCADGDGPSGVVRFRDSKSSTYTSTSPARSPHLPSIWSIGVGTRQAPLTRPYFERFARLSSFEHQLFSLLTTVPSVAPNGTRLGV